MFGRMKMLCRVLVLRGIAAADMAALEAQPQMHPAVAHLQALLAAIGWMRTDLSDLTEMCAGRHNFSPQTR